MKTGLIAIPRQAGMYVRQARQMRGWTQKTLAAEAGVSERLVNGLEAGEARGIRLDKLMKLLDALGMQLLVAMPASRKESAEPPRAEEIGLAELPIEGDESYKNLYRGFVEETAAHGRR